MAWEHTARAGAHPAGMQRPRGGQWAVAARGLVKTFGDHRAVNGLDLYVRPGTVCGLLGPNGAGKTTTIRLLTTLLRPDAGSAQIFGYDVVKEAAAVRRLIAVTGQYATVDESLTAAENLTIFARLLGLDRAEARRRTAQLLEEFGLAEAAHRPLKHFSGGMRRRLDLAAGLIVPPPVIFLDEPTTGLDPRTRRQVWDTIRRLVQEGTTVVLTTQYLEEADALADRIAVIDHGRVVAQGTPAELKASVGRATLRVRLQDPRQVETARRVLEAVLDVRVPAAAPVPQEAGEVTAPLADAGRLLDVLAALRQAGVDLTGITVQEPTLDEVFFALTGRGVNETPAEEPAAQPAGRRPAAVAQPSGGESV